MRADLGLATSPRFDLSPDEQDFVAQNMSHDAGYTMRELVNWMVANIAGVANPDTGGPVERYDYIRRCAVGDPPANVPTPAAALISRYAPVATIMNDFYWHLFGQSRATPYPAHQIKHAMSSIPGYTTAPPQPAGGAVAATQTVRRHADAAGISPTSRSWVYCGGCR